VHNEIHNVKKGGELSLA